MAFVLAVLGGAAAVEISKLLHKDTKVSIKDLEALQTKEEELKEVLQEVRVELEQEKAAHEVDSRRVQELSNFAEQLQSVKAELEQESTELKSDKQELVLKTERLLEQQVQLHNSASSLKTENKVLLQQVDSFKHAKEKLEREQHAQQQELVSSLHKHVKTLKAKVVASFERFSRNEIDSTTLLQEFHELGLDVKVTAESLDALPEARPGIKDVESMEEQADYDFDVDFSKQLRLISDSPERLSQLLATVSAAEDDKPSSSSRVPALSFPTLRSPRKEQQGGQMFSFLKAVGLTPRQDESSQSKVPALNLSSVGYRSPARSPHRALQPTTVNTDTGTALVFSTKDDKDKESRKKRTKTTLSFGAPSGERTTPRKPTTPKRTRSSSAALEFHDRENQDPFTTSLVSRGHS